MLHRVRRFWILIISYYLFYVRKLKLYWICRYANNKFHGLSVHAMYSSGKLCVTLCNRYELKAFGYLLMTPRGLTCKWLRLMLCAVFGLVKKSKPLAPCGCLCIVLYCMCGKTSNHGVRLESMPFCPFFLHKLLGII